MTKQYKATVMVEYEFEIDAESLEDAIRQADKYYDYTEEAEAMVYDISVEWEADLCEFCGDDTEGYTERLCENCEEKRQHGEDR